MANDFIKLITNMLETDSYYEHADIPQQNENIPHPEENDSVAFFRNLINKNYYTEGEEETFHRQTNSPLKQPVDRADSLEAVVKTLFELGVSSKKVGELLEQKYGKAFAGRYSMPRKLFIASSKEGVVYATALKLLLSGHFASHDLNIACVLWRDRGVFRKGESTLANLERIANELYAEGDKKRMGYAACVLTPDEIITMRGEEYSVARDNVLFEYGLFLGKLGHARTFLLIPPEKVNDDLPKFHTLSDLKGITSQYYQSYEKNANPDQAEDALFRVAQGIFYDIFEIEKKLSSQETSANESDTT